ncbi:hypothetical protein [Pantoea agglomerans]|uniref:hypothetical protein n=1 Tax=Enterobacter agglomerans TaxID=549 RepID=UPI000A90A9DE|nr:hypothetical protein [Pantoea agglomerans]
MIALTIVYPAAGFFHLYLPSEENNEHKQQKERKTRRNNRLPGSIKAKQKQRGLYF